MKQAISVADTKAELEGVFECPHCGGHFMADSTFIDQVEDKLHCMYCQGEMYIGEPISTTDNIIDGLMSDVNGYDTNIRWLLEQALNNNSKLKEEYINFFEIKLK